MLSLDNERGQDKEVLNSLQLVIIISLVIIQQYIFLFINHFIDQSVKACILRQQSGVEFQSPQVMDSISHSLWSLKCSRPLVVDDVKGWTFYWHFRQLKELLKNNRKKDRGEKKPYSYIDDDFLGCLNFRIFHEAADWRRN